MSIVFAVVAALICHRYIRELRLAWLLSTTISFALTIALFGQYLDTSGSDFLVELAFALAICGGISFGTLKLLRREPPGPKSSDPA